MSELLHCYLLVAIQSFVCLVWPVIAKLAILLLRALLFVLTDLFDLFIILGWLLIIIDYNSGVLKLLFCESMELLIFHAHCYDSP